MTDSEHIQQWDRWQRRAEKKHFAAIRAAIKAQFAQFFERGSVEDITSTGLAAPLLTLRKDAAVSWGHTVLIGLRQYKAMRPMGFSQRIYELLRDYFGIDLLNDSEDITDTTREYIRRALTEGAANGQGIDAVIEQMRKDVPELSKRRAAVIARTETVGAANKAAVAVAKDSVLVLDKKWLSVHDKRTRRDHVLEDGKTVGLDEYFNVGGYDMLQPGDRGGKDGKPKVPGKETIQCRCTLALLPKSDGRGGYVRKG